MRVVVVGASGNVGTSVLEALAGESAVDQVIGVARRLPVDGAAKTDWVSADIRTDDLETIFAGADCVVHLAWLIQPSRDVDLLDEVNIGGSMRVFEAAAAAGVGSLIVASSVGAYSAGPKDHEVDESWATGGISSCYYSRQKVAMERGLDRIERENPEMRVVRFRPAIILKGDAASGIRRLFVGPLLPNLLVRKALIPVVPDTRRLALQIVHSEDVGDACRRAIVGDARGAFNLAAEPVVDTDFLADALGARPVPVHAGLLRAAAALTWRLRLQPTDPAWLDMGLGTPLLDSSRARTELGWSPRHSSRETVDEFIEALRAGRDHDTRPLDAGTGGPFRVREFLSGVGKRQG